jgi:hypothetical protein
MLCPTLHIGVGDSMATKTSLPALPDPESITDEPSASEALHSALVAVCVANYKLADSQMEDQTGAHYRNWAAFHELMDLFRNIHGLLPKIASFRPDITSWSVTIGMSNTVTVNFANRYAKDDQIADISGPS